MVAIVPDWRTETPVGELVGKVELGCRCHTKEDPVDLHVLAVLVVVAAVVVVVVVEAVAAALLRSN